MPPASSAPKWPSPTARISLTCELRAPNSRCRHIDLECVRREHDTVLIACRVARYELLEHVRSHACRIAFERIAPSAAARRDDHGGRARRNLLPHQIDRPERRLVRRAQPAVRRQAWQAAVLAPRRVAVASGVAERPRPG